MSIPYCHAIYAYEKQELAAAADWLLVFDHAASPVSLQLLCRVTQIKVYFDLQNFGLLDSHMNSFTVYLSRHKELGYHRDICLIFIRNCRKIVQLPARISSAQKEKISEEIKQMPVAGYRSWLLDRLPK